jgi:hypothetical protein
MSLKIAGLFNSRRFWVAIGGVVVAMGDHLGLGLSPDVVQNVVVLGGAWIVGDSLRQA